MTAPAVSDLFSSRALLYLLDVESGEVTRVTNLTLVSYRDEVGSLEPQLIAWSPSSASFACVCRYSTDRLPSVWVVELSTLLPGGRVNGVSGVARQQRQVVWGDGGIAAQRESGSWHHVHPGLGILIGLERASADQLALSINREAAYYLAVRSVTQYNSQVGTSEAVEYWIGTKGAVATAPRTMPGAATTVGAASDGFVLSLRRAQGELGGVGQLAPIDVVLVDAVGATSALTVLPAGSWSPTFAADLLG